MASENVELIRRAYEDYAERGLEAIMDLLHPDVEFVEPEFIPGAEAFRGHEGAREWLRKTSDIWEEFGYELEEIAEAGDRVAVAFRMVARGKGSGVEIESHRVHVWTLRDGRAVRVEGFASRAEAWEALGLD
jgi:ketosteroid isomerase-like protein